jgi:hypothetical protein
MQLGLSNCLVGAGHSLLDRTVRLSRAGWAYVVNETRPKFLFLCRVALVC